MKSLFGRAMAHAGALLLWGAFMCFGVQWAAGQARSRSGSGGSDWLLVLGEVIRPEHWGGPWIWIAGRLGAGAGWAGD